MSLKGDRHEFLTDVSYFMNEVATRGGIVSYSTVGSGTALDQSAALVTYAANSTGNVPVGILLNDMVNLDLTRQHANYHRNEMQLGGKVTLGKKGWWVTNSIIGTPALKDWAHLCSSGQIAPITNANEPLANLSNMPRVGKFMGIQDEDGYAKVYIDL